MKNVPYPLISTLMRKVPYWPKPAKRELRDTKRDLQVTPPNRTEVPEMFQNSVDFRGMLIKNSILGFCPTAQKLYTPELTNTRSFNTCKYFHEDKY